MVLYLYVIVKSAKIKAGLFNLGKVNPFVLLQVGSLRNVHQTSVIFDRKDPVWNEEFRFRFNEHNTPLHIVVKNKQGDHSVAIGKAYFDLGSLTFDKHEIVKIDVEKPGSNRVCGEIELVLHLTNRTGRAFTDEVAANSLSDDKYDFDKVLIPPPPPPAFLSMFFEDWFLKIDLPEKIPDFELLEKKEL